MLRLGNLTSRWPLTSLSWRTLLLLLARRYLLLRRTRTLLRWVWWTAHLYLTRGLDLTLGRLRLTLHLRRSCLYVVNIRSLLLLLQRGHLLPLWSRRRFLTLLLGGSWSRRVEYPAPDLGTGNTAHAEGLGDYCAADRKAYLLDRVLLQEVGRFVEPADLTMCWCPGGGRSNRCLDG